MEPGREDREHHTIPVESCRKTHTPQWNPAVKTGSTSSARTVVLHPPMRLNGTRP